MPINDTHRIIFIHIPRCGGSYLEKQIFPNTAKKYKLTGHSSIGAIKFLYPAIFSHYHKFTIVRNPFDRLVSAFFYLKTGGMKNTKDLSSQSLLNPFLTFASFVRQLAKSKPLQRIIHFRPMTPFISLNHSITMNQIIKFEDIFRISVPSIPSKISTIKIGTKNITIPPATNKSQHRDFREYYRDDPELIAIVVSIYKDDFTRFGYAMEI